MSEFRSRCIELRRIAKWLAIVLLFAGPASSQSADAVAPADRFATFVELNGPIGPAMSRYVERSLADAGNQHSAVIILEMDTPGGLDTSMRDIIKAILASPVPVVAYVAPSGARAASAGTYILYASHFAAMAPATNLGAATPISIGGEPSSPPAAPPINPSDGEKQKPPRIFMQERPVSAKPSTMPSPTSVRWRNCAGATPIGPKPPYAGPRACPRTMRSNRHVIDIVAERRTGSIAAASRTQDPGGRSGIHARYPGTCGAEHCARLAHACAVGVDPPHHCLRAAA